MKAGRTRQSNFRNSERTNLLSGWKRPDYLSDVMVGWAHPLEYLKGFIHYLRANRATFCQYLILSAINAADN